MWNKGLLLVLAVLALLGGVPGPCRAQAAPSPRATVRDVLARKEFQQYTGRAHAPATPAQSVLKDVLSREEFQRYSGHASTQTADKPSAFSRALQHFGQWVNRGLTKAMKPVAQAFRWVARHLAHAMPKTPSDEHMSFLAHSWQFFFHSLLLPLLVLAVVVLLGVLISRWYFARQRRQTLHAEEGDASPLAHHGPPPLGPWDRMLQTVEALWQQGQQREALRTLHHACLTLLDRRGVLRYDESRANGEVLRELRRQQRRQLQQTLVPIFRAFDRSWYGFLTLSGEEFTTVKEHSRLFHEGMQGGHDG